MTTIPKKSTTNDIQSESNQKVSYFVVNFLVEYNMQIGSLFLRGLVSIPPLPVLMQRQFSYFRFHVVENSLLYKRVKNGDLNVISPGRGCINLSQT